MHSRNNHRYKNCEALSVKVTLFYENQPALQENSQKKRTFKARDFQRMIVQTFLSTQSKKKKNKHGEK